MVFELECSRCDGSGVEPGTESDDCIRCGGDGTAPPDDMYVEILGRIKLMDDKVDAVKDRVEQIWEKLNE